MNMLRPALRESIHDARLSLRSRRLPPAFHPLDLWANGELGVFSYPGNENVLFSDYAGTTLITAEAAVIANVHDLTPNNTVMRQLTTTKRPVLQLLPASSRRIINYDVTDDAMVIQTPNMGAGCTVFRARPGIGGVITPGVTIGGAQTDSTDSAAMGIINRALTVAETSALKLWLDQASGQLDEFNVSYGPAAAEKFDVYHQGGHLLRPIIIMVHGGGWRNGDKLLDNVIKNKLQHWLPLGFTFVSVNYTLDIGTSPVAQANAVARAAAKVQSLARGWGCDPRKIILMGHSAGANLVMQVTANSKLRSDNGMASWLGTVAIDSAAYDVTQIMSGTHLPLYDEPWGVDPALWVAGSPTLMLDCTPPPSFLITSTTTDPGEADSNVGPYRDAVIARGGYAEIYHTTLDHGGTNSEMGKISQYTTDVDTFISKLLGLTPW